MSQTQKKTFLSLSHISEKGNRLTMRSRLFIKLINDAKKSISTFWSKKRPSKQYELEHDWLVVIGDLRDPEDHPEIIQ